MTYHSGVSWEIGIDSTALDHDRNHGHGITGSYSNVGGGGHGGMIYNIAYARAMFQAAMIVEGRV